MNATRLIALCSILTWANALFASPEQLTDGQARHLLLRTGFAPSQAEVEAVTGQSARMAVTRVLTAATASKTIHPAPDFVSLPPPIPYAFLKTQEEQQAMRQQQLCEGMVALKSALVELGAWDRTLVITFSEFGRRARQNNSGGTDHGTAAPHFVAGGDVRGGLYGQAPDLTRLDAAQNLVHTTDFRQLYAGVAKGWWGVAPELVVRGTFDPIKFLRG